MRRQFAITIEKDGSIHWDGVDTGPTTLVAIKESERLMVIKIAGHTAWIDRMTQHQYVPARYEVHRYDLIERTPNRMRAKIELWGMMGFGSRGEKRPLPEQLEEAFNA